VAWTTYAVESELDSVSNVDVELVGNYSEAVVADGDIVC